MRATVAATLFALSVLLLILLCQGGGMGPFDVGETVHIAARPNARHPRAAQSRVSLHDATQSRHATSARGVTGVSVVSRAAATLLLLCVAGPQRHAEAGTCRGRYIVSADAGGNITDGDGDYAPFQECEWLVRVDNVTANTTRVALNIVSFDTECSYDFMFMCVTHSFSPSLHPTNQPTIQPTNHTSIHNLVCRLALPTPTQASRHTQSLVAPTRNTTRPLTHPPTPRMTAAPADTTGHRPPRLCWRR
jgi:hypothetical protein